MSKQSTSIFCQSKNRIHLAENNNKKFTICCLHATEHEFFPDLARCTGKDCLQSVSAAWGQVVPWDPSSHHPPSPHLIAALPDIPTAPPPPPCLPFCSRRTEATISRNIHTQVFLLGISSLLQDLVFYSYHLLTSAVNTTAISCTLVPPPGQLLLVQLPTSHSYKTPANWQVAIMKTPMS